jgi:NADP-dependent 3-hydroxy acid dehydrogenase YdfG
MPVIAIVGAGPQFGRSVAHVFGSNGYSTALIARRRESLDEMIEHLERHGVTANGYLADVRDSAALTAALNQAAAELGPIDVLAYNPLPSPDYLHTLDETTIDQARDAFAFSVLGPMTAVQAVLPSMRERGTGSLLFTSGGSSITPNPNVAGTSIAMAGEAAYAQMLHDTLADQGIHVAHLVIRVGIAPGNNPGDPDDLAQQLWELHQDRNTFRTIIG